MRGWVLAVAAVLLAGCAGAQPGDGAGTASADPSPSPVTLEVACPETLLEPAVEEDGSVAIDPAPAVPDLGRVGGAWVCAYALGAGEDADSLWTLSDGPAEVPLDRLAEVAEVLDGLQVPPVEQACTADLGPRYLLMVGSGDEATGVAFDDFGCHQVRLTEDPWSVAPGLSEDPNLVPGVLAAGTDAIARLLDAAGLAGA